VKHVVTELCRDRKCGRIGFMHKTGNEGFNVKTTSVEERQREGGI